MAIQNLARVAQEIGLELIAEVELDETFELPDDMLEDTSERPAATLYATMPTMEALRQLLARWHAYQRGDPFPRGTTPWRNLFDMLVDLRPWGPQDRLTGTSRDDLFARLEEADEADDLHLELEVWPTRRAEQRARWQEETEARVVGLSGVVVDRAEIGEEGLLYHAILARLPARQVRALLDDPSAPGSLATLDGIQFILPQTIAQTTPGDDELEDPASPVEYQPFDAGTPLRALLLDGTPVAGHAALDGGVVIEDVHELVPRSLVEHRKHATSMASLILRGDLEADGAPAADTRLLSIPILIDAERDAASPTDRLFVDVLHQALASAFLGDEPLAPDAFVVNLSIGIRNSYFMGQMSALARLLDWWSARHGVLFVVAAGNIGDLELPGVTSTAFEDAGPEEQRALVSEALRNRRHVQTMLAPADALNALTVGACAMDLVTRRTPPPPGVVALGEDDVAAVAVGSRTGLGLAGAVKPDVLATGGLHDVRLTPAAHGVRLRVGSPSSGLNVASAAVGDTRARTRGTSCATALTTRAVLDAAAALTADDGPYAGQELDRHHLALLTRVLAVHAATWSSAADDLLREETQRSRTGRITTAIKEEVARYYGHGVLDPTRMLAAPITGGTLVGTGSLRRDDATIFDLPLPPSLSEQKLGRSLLVTIAWFSPVDPGRMRYRLAGFEAVAADGDGSQKDDGWSLKMKSHGLDASTIKRGTVWSRRLIHATKKAPTYDLGTTLPIRVQCRDVSGGGLDQDEEIPFALAVTLETEVGAEFDVREEIEEALRIRARGSSG